MRRRTLLTGLATLAGVGVGLRPSAQAKSRRVELISAHSCQSRGTGPFSLETRGVGSVIVRAWSPRGNVAVVVPTVPFSAKTARYVLHLRELERCDALFVCPLHRHWDHAKHLDQWLELLAPGGHATLIAPPGQPYDRRGGDRYAKRISPALGTIEQVLFDGDVLMRLYFVVQGETRDGHAAHFGAGRRCTPEHPNCGTKLVPYPPLTYCLIGELEQRGARFRFFINDAASSHVASALSHLPLPRPIDLAVLTIPDAHLAYGYPEQLISVLQPRELRWAHWENFILGARNSRARMHTGRRARTFAASALPKWVLEHAQAIAAHDCAVEHDCFIAHGYREFFAGRPK